MTTPDDAIWWKRSSFCGASAGCVEVSLSGDGNVLVRDSENPALPPLEYTPIDWDAEIDDQKNGDPYAVEGAPDDRGFVWHWQGRTLQFTGAEVKAFRAGVLAGEFDYDRLSSPTSSEGCDAGLDQVGVGGGSNLAATGAGAIAVPPVPVAANHEHDPIECGCELTPEDAPVPVAATYDDMVIRKVEPRYIVDNPPQRTAIALEVLRAADDRALFISGDTLWVGEDAEGNELAYRVTGWDPKAKALVIERQDELDLMAPPSVIDDANEWTVTVAPPGPRWGAGPLVEHVPETPAAREVWSGAVAPGGYVCGAPDPNRPDGICGMPVESEPCSEHNPETPGTGSAVPDREEIERRDRLAESWAEDD